MKVVFVSRFPIGGANSPRGGVETATVSLARALLASGIEDLHIVALERGREDVTVEQHEGITVHRLPRTKMPMMIDVFVGPGFRSLYQYLKGLNPDIVHFHETWGLGANRMNLPSIFTVHGFDSLNLPTEQAFMWRLRSWIWAKVENFGIRRQRHLISIAPYVGRELRKRSTAKIHDIWNSLGDGYFSMSRQEQPARILFLGWINPRKNAVTVVEAAARLIEEFPYLKVRLCGEASDQAYAARLEQTIEQLSMGEYVDVCGRLNQSEVAEEIKQASIMVLPSLQENAPMVVAECMAAGLPVVASNLCGMPDMIDDGDTGYLVDPFDIEAIAGAVKRLLLNDELRAQLGSRAKDVAYQRFHPTSVAAATIEAYREAIESFDTLHAKERVAN